MTAPLAAPSIRRDILSSYAASAARVASWLIISALVFRASPFDFALLALLRATIGILNYTSLGLGPAMIHALAQAASTVARVSTKSEIRDSTKVASSPSSAPVLDYAGAPDERPTIPIEISRPLLANGLAVALVTGVAGLYLLVLYAGYFDDLHQLDRVAPDMPALVLLLGVGTLLRLGSDACGAVLQVSARIGPDNFLLILSEALWVTLTWYWMTPAEPLYYTCLASALSGLFLAFMRFWWANETVRLPIWFLSYVDPARVIALLRYGSLVAAAQIADFLFAPTDYILINRFISTEAVAIYAPAVQIDAGLLLLVSALANVLLPRAAVAHAAGDAPAIRRYYVLGTIASATLLAFASLCVWAAAPVIFKLWFGQDLPATRAILPLVLLHTVIGGSTTVGRSILLAMGRVKPYTASVLITAVMNVILSYIFVRHLHWGLYGIVAGTLSAAVVRGIFWTPWYVLRTIERSEELESTNREAVN